MFVNPADYFCTIKLNAMNTFILPWRPGESDFTLARPDNELLNPDYGDFLWPSAGLGKARSGDNFFLVRMDGDPFVVMKGFFLSDPDREKGLMGLRPSFIALPSAGLPQFSMDALDRSTPGFSWALYCNGEPLPDWAGKKLSGLWEVFLQEEFKEEFFDGVHAERSRKPAANVDDAIQIASDVFCDEVDPLDGKPAILSTLRIAVRGNDENQSICGALRDVIGRAGWTPGRLRDCGFSEQVVDRLVTLRWEDGETPDQHFKRVYDEGDRIAWLIMLWDQEDKMARGGCVDPKFNTLRAALADQSGRTSRSI